MTNQAMFNKVVRHLLRQGVRSLRNRGKSTEMCAYRSDNGLRCAIGVLIPDKAYRDCWEGSTIYSGEYTSEVQQSAGISQRNRSLASALQDIHDHGTVDMWMRELRFICTRFKLKFPRIPRTQIAKACGGLA